MTLRLDQWLLGVLGSPAAVGIYSIAASLSEAIYLVARSLGIVVFVDSARAERGQQFRRRLAGALVITSVAAAALAAVCEPLIRVVIGDDYLGAAAPTRILLLGAPGLITVNLITNRLAGMGRPGRASGYTLAALIVTVALDIWLIPRSGAEGAAWASAIGYNVGGLVALSALRTSKSVPRRAGPVGYASGDRPLEPSAK
jgi:O-antigen/teichoic acid export membrane protein